MWEAERAQQKFDQSPTTSTNASVSFHANTVVTTDRIDLRYVSFENMSEYLRTDEGEGGRKISKDTEQESSSFLTPTLLSLGYHLESIVTNSFPPR